MRKRLIVPPAQVAHIVTTQVLALQWINASLDFSVERGHLIQGRSHVQGVITVKEDLHMPMNVLRALQPTALVWRVFQSVQYVLQVTFVVRRNFLQLKASVILAIIARMEVQRVNKWNVRLPWFVHLGALNHNCVQMEITLPLVGRGYVHLVQRGKSAWQSLPKKVNS